MYENIAKNKAKTVFVIIGFLLFIGIIGYAVGMYFDWRYGISGGYSTVFMLFALAIATIVSFASYYNSDKIVLRLSRARPLSREENPRVY